MGCGQLQNIHTCRYSYDRSIRLHWGLAVFEVSIHLTSAFVVSNMNVSSGHNQVKLYAYGHLPRSKCFKLVCLETGKWNVITRT